ncbi:hypothetical protein [Streptomyces xinghaiensis]|uniref:hypothetical protein n=1 Tax=Streptomyces xinghaiensis TaxID=1038928 RepID=UPI0002F23C59|nr:hypothetical protein [Streptomyces xinghaiensis]MZE79788.1 hypothetical protein [Streptomyces sp. SID5475]
MVMVGQHARSSPEKVYLSDVEIHRQSPIASAEDLRARVLFHVLLSDTLLVGDSQSLNTPLFRALVSSHEAGGQAVRSDLAPLLGSGRIRVACRDGQRLTAVRDAQKLRKVEHVPSAAYAELVDRMTHAHAVTYRLDAVSAAFKSGVIRLLEELTRDAGGETRGTVEAALEFVRGQEPLYFKALRDWEESFRTNSSGSTEVVLAVAAVDRAAGESYRQALPHVLGAGTAAPRSVELPAAATRTVLERTSLPAGVLDGFLLGRLPVEVFLEATEQPSRGVLVRQLGLLRRGSRPDLSQLVEAMAEFSNWVQEAFVRAFRDTDERARAVLDGNHNLMRFGIFQDSLTGALGAGLDMPAAGGEEDYLELQVVDRSVPAADGAAGIGALDARQMRQRVITGAYVG